MRTSDPYEPNRGVTTDDVASYIQLPTKGQLPTIFLAVAPCRSGTTTQLRVFATAGMEAYYQPLKATLRCLMHNLFDKFIIPAREQIFIKETIGPYTETEARLNPLEVLLKAGYPPEKIRLIPEMREPLSTLASWQEQFSFDRDKNR